jgi:hypothetical protein
LQGTNGHADQLGDLLSALSSLNEISDLLESFWSKLYLSSASWELRGKLLGLHHYSTFSGRDVQAICRRRRANTRRIPLAKTRPGRPAPAIGLGTPEVASIRPVLPFPAMTSAKKKAVSVQELHAWKLARVRPAAEIWKSSVFDCPGLIPPVPPLKIIP